MKYNLLLLLSITIYSILGAQQPVFNSNAETFGESYMKKHTTTFNLVDGKLVGTGGDLLMNEIRKAQFTILGERHGSTQLGKLTEILLPHLKKAGYENFALEVGPITSEILSGLCDNKESIKDQLYKINTKYRVGTMDDLMGPIPFFDGIEDAAFLQVACELDFNLWGIDQEFFNAPLMLSDELVSLAKGKANFKQIQSDQYHFDTLFIAGYLKDSAGDDESFLIFDHIRNHPHTTKFFKHFDGNEEAQKIIEALSKTWDIYNRYSLKGGKSHQHRIAYIRQNFTRYYQESKTKHPKVFMKIGNVHAEKFFEGRIYDVGNLTYELAQHNKTSSIHIYCTSRYYENEGVVDDYHKDWDSFIFNVTGLKDKWAVVDLKTIHEDISNFNLHLPKTIDYHFIKNLVRQYDYILIPPIDKYVTPNCLEKARTER